MLTSLAPQLIGIHGDTGSGKDSIARFLNEDYGYIRLAFADLLKRELVEAFRCNPDLFQIPHLKTINTEALALVRCRDRFFVEWCLRNRAASDLGLLEFIHRQHTPRETMQAWGDYRKATVSSHYFIDNVVKQVRLARMAGKKVAVTDVRSIDEAITLVAQGDCRLIEVLRPGNPYASKDQHASNRPLGNAIMFDKVIVNQGDLENLKLATQGMIKGFSQELLTT